MPLDPIAYKPYADPDDFIREVTDFIWVQRGIGFIRENYEPDSIVHTGFGTITTRDEVIAGSLMRQAGPGATRIGQAEDVVWEARGDDAFLSSHLILGAGPDNPYCSRTIAAQEPDGVTIRSLSPNTRTKRRMSAVASSW